MTADYKEMLENWDVEDASDIGLFLNEMSHEDRLLFIQKLKDATVFCWHCGWEYNQERICHCRNDD